jgi:predicted 3-demethylubiquinone-9 3-methyltransferase (glyoxalase superfamily)
MSNKLYPCLWFDNQAKEAALFYCSLFNQSRIVTDTPLVVKFEIEGKLIMGLNGGPKYKINPSISFFVTCSSHDEIDSLYTKLIEDGMAMMPLDKYPWGEKYGWVVDKFGMTWQLMLGELHVGTEKIKPSLLFTGAQYGKATEAINLYTSLFPDSSIIDLQITNGVPGHADGNLLFGHFSLLQDSFAAMDGPGEHAFQFNEGVSFVVECADQEEIDYFWYNLSEGGAEVQCGWLTDKFGISWQIIPDQLPAIMSDPGKSGKAMKAIMPMKKIDIATLIKATES